MGSKLGKWGVALCLWLISTRQSRVARKLAKRRGLDSYP